MKKKLRKEKTQKAHWLGVLPRPEDLASYENPEGFCSRPDRTHPPPGVRTSANRCPR